MPRVGIDARISRSWSTGVGIYTLRLVEALCALAPWHRYFLFTGAQAPPAPLAADAPVEQRRAPYGVGGLGQHMRLPLMLRSLPVDVLITTHPACAPVWSPCPRLVFVHDLIPLVLPHYYSAAKRLYYRTAVPWSLRRAARVLVDSESTRRDCERLLRLPAARLRVVYGGPGCRASSNGRHRADEPDRPYVLYVGNKRPHKNLDRLIEAFAVLLRDEDPGCDLVIAGRDEPGDVETDGQRLRAQARRLGLDGRVRFAGEVAEEALAPLYANAEAFVYLSAYEGFGLPPLEAMACGTPVVALDASSLREVVGEGGVLLDTAEPAAVARSLRAILTDRSLRQRLSERALQQASKFSWDETARAVAEEIEAALAGRRPA